MPMHDWTRVTAGTYHNFHYRWIAAVIDRLNAGVLPTGFFAMAEQRIQGPEPDVITLQTTEPDAAPVGTSVLVSKPAVRFQEKAQAGRYARKTNRVAIHHELGTVVSIIEIVSPGNKNTGPALRSFVRKAAALIRRGVHVLIADPFPPGRYNRQGLHREVWAELGEETHALVPDKPLMLASYESCEAATAYVEPFAVGDVLATMPLFIREGEYVNVPLEETYQTTWNLLPAEIRRIVEPPRETPP